MMPLSRIRARAAMIGASAAATLIVACGGDTGSGHVDAPPSTPAVWSLDKVAPGDDLQTDTVLATSASVRVVVRANGAPRAGVAVAWTVNGATNATTSTTTGSDGVSTLSFAFGSKAASYDVRAAVPARPELPPVSFSGSAVPGHAAVLRVVSGSGQSDSATARLHDDFVVQAADSHGNATAGVPVDWAVAAGGGSISQSRTTADSTGSAAARYTLGRTAGANSVTATLHGADAKASFQVMASPANPAKLIIVSGNNQTAEAGHALASDYVVEVADSYGNPVAGVAIDWAIASGGGRLSASQATSGADGLGATRLTLGSMVAEQSANSSLESWPNVPAVVFNSTATPPPPAPTLVLVSGGGQSAVTSTQLPAPILFRALDAVGLPLAGKTITFTAPGTVVPATAITDAQGFAQAIWTLGPNAGLQTLVATATFATVVGSANALATLPPLAIVGDSLYDQVVLDPTLGLNQFTFGAVRSPSPVAGPVTVTLSHGGHTSMPASVMIASGGTIGRFRIDAMAPGTDTIVASAPGYVSATYTMTVGLGNVSGHLFLPFVTLAVGATAPGSICISTPDGGMGFTASAMTFSLAPSANISVSDPFNPGTPITSIGFPIPGANCLSISVKGLSAGPASMTITNPFYKTGSFSTLVVP